MRALVLFVVACKFQPSEIILIDAKPDAPIDAPPPPQCFDAARCHHRTIVIDHSRVVGGPHAQFPVVVVVEDPDLANAAPGGIDAVFTQDGTTKLPYEREVFANDELIAWVALPSLPSDSDTTFHLFYGDAAATVDEQQPAAVWDPGFQAVYHLAQTTGGTGALVDSTTHGNAGTDEGGLAVGTPGKIGRAAQFAGDDDRIHVPQAAGLDSVGALGTLELWVRWDNPANGQTPQRLLMQSNTFAGDSTGFEWATQTGGFYYYYPSEAGGNTGVETYDGFNAPFAPSTWYHLAIAQELATKTATFYIDGNALTPDVDNISTNWKVAPSPGDWFWGGAGSRSNFAGFLDEIRVSNVIRSPGWIATEHANQLSPSDFCRVGP